MTNQDAKEVVLTPEQRRRLGQVYRLILSWRRERKNKKEEPSQVESTEGKARSIETNSHPIDSIESED
ncbi:MAG TPA: hypothetical protein VJ044_12365 [Candidatus Hodarchaeales archaeon]|nr:hypothetical protein [Candidatus Hodarchaeales archaeon]